MNISPKKTYKYQTYTIKQTNKDKIEIRSVVRRGRNRNFHTLLVGIGNGAALMENRMEIPYKNKELNYYMIEPSNFWILIQKH